jgi:hypothetical protein
MASGYLSECPLCLKLQRLEPSSRSRGPANGLSQFPSSDLQSGQFATEGGEAFGEADHSSGRRPGSSGTSCSPDDSGFWFVMIFPLSARSKRPWRPGSEWEKQWAALGGVDCIVFGPWDWMQLGQGADWLLISSWPNKVVMIGLADAWRMGVAIVCEPLSFWGLGGFAACRLMSESCSLLAALSLTAFMTRRSPLPLLVSNHSLEELVRLNADSGSSFGSNSGRIPRSPLE